MNCDKCEREIYTHDGVVAWRDLWFCHRCLAIEEKNTLKGGGMNKQKHLVRQLKNLAKQVKFEEDENWITRFESGKQTSVDMQAHKIIVELRELGYFGV